MKTYVLHKKAPLDRDEEGHPIAGTHAVSSFYVEVRTDDLEIADIAGPFDDEYDAEMAARRIRQLAQ